MQELIRELTEGYGPSGNEERVRTMIQEHVQGLVDEVRTDALGNLICVRRPTAPGSGLKVMLSAHMDEIGFVVTHIDDDGFVRFDLVGGNSPFRLLGQRVAFADGTVGVIGTEKIDEIKDLKLEKLFIDVGMSGEGAKSHITIGDMATYHRPMETSGDRVIAKALDDRIGCAILVEFLRRKAPSPHEIYCVFTVQEEVGLRGATTAAFGVKPDLGIAVDVTSTGDTPKARTMDVKLGKGVAIKMKDRSLIAHPRVKDLLLATAEDRDIPHQREVLEFGGTDAGAIHLTRGGVPSGTLSIPCRYIHTPSEMVDMVDVRACVDLLEATLAREITL